MMTLARVASRHLHLQALQVGTAQGLPAEQEEAAAAAAASSDCSATRWRSHSPAAATELLLPVQHAAQQAVASAALTVQYV
jgi:hypothetical protein